MALLRSAGSLVARYLPLPASCGPGSIGWLSSNRKTQGLASEPPRKQGLDAQKNQKKRANKPKA